MLRSFVFILGVTVACAHGWAASAPDEQHSSYYSIDDGAPRVEAGFSDPWALLRMQRIEAAGVNLLKWIFNDSDWPEPPEKYNRKKHFGEWMNDPRDNECHNTRATVLIRDSKRPVTFNSGGCTVRTGEWHEPYNGLVHTSATDVQIDHVVALKNTYISGGWRWSRLTRCVYANFLANDFHLVAADGRANLSKGDQTPATWMPRNKAHTCDYLRDWLSIKLIWGLLMNPKETAAIQSEFRKAGCDAADFRFSAAELRA